VKADRAIRDPVYPITTMHGTAPDLSALLGVHGKHHPALHRHDARGKHHPDPGTTLPTGRRALGESRYFPEERTQQDRHGRKVHPGKRTA
jgi:hypothetical protein